MNTAMTKRGFAMFRKSQNISTIFLVMGMGLFLSGCVEKVKAPAVPSGIRMHHSGEKTIRLNPMQAQASGLQTAVVERVPFHQQVLSSGQVEASAYLQAHVFSAVPGKALNVPVTVGQTVRTGQVLATMKSDQIGQIESDLLTQDLQNRAAIRQAKAQLAFSESGYKRELYLYNKMISAKVDYETAYTQYVKDEAALEDQEIQRKAAIDTAARRLALYGADPNIAYQVVRTRAINPYITIRAPRNGVVIARSLNNGEMTDPSKEIFTIADLHKIWLAGNIYETDLTKVHEGQPIQVTLDSLPGRIFHGKLNFISRVLDPNIRTVEARGEVDNPDELLRPNMFARMAVQVDNQVTLAVPSSAVQQRGIIPLFMSKSNPIPLLNGLLRWVRITGNIHRS